MWGGAGAISSPHYSVGAARMEVSYPARSRLSRFPVRETDGRVCGGLGWGWGDDSVATVVVTEFTATPSTEAKRPRNAL